MDNMNYMRPFWERRIEDLDTAKAYAEVQLDSLLLKVLGQLAIPIEAAMDEENDELTGTL